MKTTTLVAIGFFAATAIILFFGTKNWWPTLMTPKAKACPPPATTAGNTSGSVTSPTSSATTPSPPPAPAPVTTPRNYSWGWWLVVIAAVALGWWGYNNLQLATTPASRATAPEKAAKAPTERMVPLPLNFVGGKKASLDGGMLKISPGGFAIFEFDNPPSMSHRATRYQIFLEAQCNDCDLNSKMHLQLETSPERFDFPIREGQQDVIFLGKYPGGGGKIGEPRMFPAGKVRMKFFSDPGISTKIVVSSCQAQLVYNE